jgi:hypothetical protein
MRRRVIRALVTAAAAGVTVAGLSLPASATTAAGHGGGVFTPSGGTPIPTDANCAVPPVPAIPRGTPPGDTIAPTPAENCARAGYQASGRDFRFAQALITVPDHPGSIESPADPTLYVALDNSSDATWQYARVGIAPCPQGVAGVAIVPGGTITCPTTGAGNTSNWVVFAATADAGATPLVTVHPLPDAVMGDGILVNVYLTPTGNSVHTVIQLPDGTTYNNTFPVTGPVYTHAQALADWNTAVENGATLPEPAVPASKTRDTQFFQGRFSTAGGEQGTFAGPWTLNAMEATSNATLPPTGTLIAQPSYLWNDQNGFNGLGQDAFGVWRFPF